MQTFARNIPNSVAYIRCGEILKSQKGFQNPYILRCLHCKEIYLLLESFILHFAGSCKKTVIGKHGFHEQSCDLSETEVINEPLFCEDEAPVKLENCSAQMEDPLIVVKNEADIENSIVKIEPVQCNESENFDLGNSTDVDATKYLDVDVDEHESQSNSEDEYEYQETEREVEITKKPTNTIDASSAFVNNFIKSEENLTALIAAFKDQPQIWNRTMPYFGNAKRREYMIKIADDLNANHNININGSQVSDVIDHLYEKYQDDLHRTQEEDESKMQMYVKPWYLTQLDFIKPHLEKFSLEILGPNLPNLLHNQIIQILKIYKNLPHLWNFNLIEYHYKKKRDESMEKMLQQLETDMNLKIDGNTLEQYIRIIHNNFSREKRRMLNNKKSSKSDKVDQTHTSDYYELLMFLYDHVPPFICSVCGNESVTPLHFKMHTSSHDGSMPFSCSHCNRTFKRVTDYTGHLQRHFNNIDHICKECGKKFVNCTNLRFHMRIHTGDKPYCCELCGDSFRFLQALSNHLRRHEKRYLHTCKICSQGFYSKMRHDDHMNSHMNIRSHICDICSKTFITKKALKIHKVVHEDVRNFACKLCGKTFKHKTGVNQHMKTHDIATTEERRII